MDDEMEWSGWDFRSMPEEEQHRRCCAAKLRARGLRQAAIAEFLRQVGRAVAPQRQEKTSGRIGATRTVSP